MLLLTFKSPYFCFLYFLLSISYIHKNSFHLKLTKRVKKQLLIYEILNILLIIVICFSPLLYPFLLILLNFIIYWISFLLSYIIEKIIVCKNIKKAKIKLKQFHPIIIGISGSYGKTSIKNFAYELLSNHFYTYQTPQSYNTVNGILKCINEELKPYHQVMLIEIGVDEKNGMNKFLKWLDVDIGVVSIIGKQHLKTFHTLQNIANEKTKLLYHSKKCCIINNDDPYLNQLSLNTSCISVSLKQGDICAFNIQESFSKIQFNLKIFDKIYPVFLKLNGIHHIKNVLFAVAIAKALNIEDKSILQNINKIKNAPHRLSTFIDQNIEVIDDAYNSNFDGFLSALNVLSLSNHKKAIITPGIIEQKSNKQNDRIIADKINEIVDIVLIVKQPSFKDYLKKYKEFNSFNEAYYYLKNQYTDEKITLLIENDVPDIYLK